MKIEFNNWIEMLKTVIELGKENGYEIYDESNSENLNVYKEINKSCKHNNTVFLTYKNRGKNNKSKTDRKYIITYIKEYGFDGGFGADMETKKEIYTNKEIAYLIYNSLVDNLDVYDLRIKEV